MQLKLPKCVFLPCYAWLQNQAEDILRAADLSGMAIQLYARPLGVHFGPLASPQQREKAIHKYCARGAAIRSNYNRFFLLCLF